MAGAMRPPVLTGRSGLPDGHQVLDGVTDNRADPDHFLELLHELESAAAFLRRAYDSPAARCCQRPRPALSIPIQGVAWVAPVES
ncbi:MAG: hypothetical protein ACREJL_07260, partial [Candidatus Methylomirabilales bacterium]